MHEFIRYNKSHDISKPVPVKFNICIFTFDISQGMSLTLEKYEARTIRFLKLKLDQRKPVTKYPAE